MLSSAKFELATLILIVIDDAIELPLTNYVPIDILINHEGN